MAGALSVFLPQAPSVGGGHQWVWVYAAVAVASLMVYANTYFGGFVYDDRAAVLQNGCVIHDVIALSLVPC